MKKEYKKTVRLIICTCLLINSIFPLFVSAQKLLKPASHFGFAPGTDRQLFYYEDLINYLKILDKQSGRLKLLKIGETELGKPMFITFISSSKNINNLDSLKIINQKLATNPSIEPGRYSEYIQKGKIFFLATLSMHSNEVGPSQSAPTIAYELACTNNSEMLKWLNDVVFMMVPCHNPDGMDMVVDHYNNYKGTKYEKSYMPGVYHKYVGHDNNRDFITLSQKETKAISGIYSKEWFPQVMIEKHQMGKTGVRYFIPPNHDPISENIDEELWSWTWVFGSNMLKDMPEKELKGVAQHYLFDNYWPGSTETSNWKNVVSLLSEAASVWHATPVFVEKNELNVYGKGLSEYIDKGGTIIAWRKSTELFMETLKLDSNENETLVEFKLPIKDVSKKLHSKDFKCYGSFLSVDVLQKHPLTWGMSSKSGVFHRSSPVFKTGLPIFDMDRRVIVSFSEDNILQSGYCKNETLLKKCPTMVWLKKGKGQVILFSFNPQFRASTPVTYKLLFNSILNFDHE